MHWVGSGVGRLEDHATDGDVDAEFSRFLKRLVERLRVNPVGRVPGDALSRAGVRVTSRCTTRPLVGEHARVAVDELLVVLTPALATTLGLVDCVEDD